MKLFTPRGKQAEPESPRGRAHKHATGAGMRQGGDHPSLHTIVVVGTIVVALASFGLSIFGQLAVAVWQQTPSFAHFLTVIMVDAPIIVFSGGVIIFKAREQAWPEWVCRVLAILMTLVSSANNFLHTVEVGGLADYRAWIGASMNALAPILVYACVEVLGSLLVRPKAKNTPLAKARALAAERLVELKQLRKVLRAGAPKASATPALKQLAFEQPTLEMTP